MEVTHLIWFTLEKFFLTRKGSKIMNTACLKFCFLSCLISLLSCFGKDEQYERYHPIEIHLANQYIEPLDSIDKGNYYVCRLKGVVINNTRDTIWTEKGVHSNALICKVNYYILQSRTVYEGLHIPHSPMSEFVEIFPNDTITFTTLFVLKKEYIDMDDLYLGISPSFSISLPPFDTTIITQPPKVLMDNAVYQPIYKFHIDSKKSEIEQINLDIDSLINEKKYQVVKVNFW